jgi:Zn-dependent alcohol dehydrogenase
MLTKEKMHELVDHMPKDEFTIDDMVEQMILLQKIETARKQIENGEFLTEEEFDKEVDKWD